MAVIGYATLQVIPSMQGVAGNLSSQVAGPFRAVGAQAGEAVASGLESAQARVAAASGKLAAARDKEADAAGKVRVAEAQLQALLDKGVTDAGRLAQARERVAKAQRDGIRASDAAKSAADQLAAAERAVEESGDQAVGMFSRMRSGLGSLGGGLSSTTKQLAGMAAAGAGIGGAMELGMRSLENGALNDKLAASLGASPELAQQYGKMAGDLYANNFGDSMEQVNEAIGLVATSFVNAGSEGEAATDKIAENALNFASIFDTDLPSAVQTASQLVTNGLAANSTEAFDLMTASFQRVPAAMRDELPEILQEYGTNFRALGFDGEESFSLLVQAAQNGKFALDKTGDALKEFTLLGSDMSESSQSAYQAIGLNAEEMSRKVAMGGEPAQEALQAVANGLLGMSDPLARANTAIALFGTPLEDLSVDQIPTFLSALTGGENAMAGFEGSAEQAGATLSQGPLAAMNTFSRGLEQTFTNMLGDNVMPLLGDFTTQLGENEGSLLATVAGMTGFGGALAGFEQAKGVFDSVSGGVSSLKDAATSAKDAISTGWENTKAAAEWVKTSATATLEAGKTAAAWVGAQAKTAAGWAASSARAIGSFVATAASATANAAVVAAQWIASNARAAASFVASRAVMLASATATGVITAAQWALNAAMSANPIGIVIAALVALGAGLVVAYNKSETFRNIVQGAWDGIKAAVSFAWNDVIQPVLGWLGEGFTKAGELGTWLWQNAIKPAMDGIGAAVSWVWQNAFSPAFEAWKSGFSAVGDFFGGVADTIGGVWDRIVIAVKKAVGTIGRILQKIEIPDWVPGIGGKGTRGLGDSLVAWAAPYRSGGTVRGPGTGTSDSILARLSNGEYVEPAHAVTPETLPLLDAIRAGWVPSPAFVDALVNGLPGFWAGGPVNANAAVSFAKSKNGLPYVYGGASGDSWDCSGYMSGIHNALTGESVRYVTGSDFASLGYVRGFDPNGFSIGTNGGVGENGHMAGTLFGTNVESDGSNGVQYGGSADGANDFPQVWHLPMSGDRPSTQDLGALGAGGAPLPGASSGPGGALGGATFSAPGTGGSGGSGGGASSSTATGNATAEEIAQATPVKVVNWPGSFGSGAAPAGAATVGTAGDPGAAYGAPVGTAADGEGTNLAGDFAKAQFDQFMSDLGISGSSGAIPKLIEQIGKIAEEMRSKAPATTEVHYHVSDMAEALRAETARKREEALTWIRR